MMEIVVNMKTIGKILVVFKKNGFGEQLLQCMCVTTL